MKLTFFGVGDATDPALGSSAILLESETKLLVDCGLGAPSKLLTETFEIESLDAIYFTHFHADHIFGIVGVLISLSLEGRQKPLRIIGQPGTQKRVEALMELGYPGRILALGFDLQFIETTSPVTLGELALSFAPTDHPLRNFAIKVECRGLNVGISGDGAMTSESKELFQNCQIIVHETFGIDQTMKGHTSAAEILARAAELPGLNLLAMVHLNKHLRRTNKEGYLKLSEPYQFTTIVPEPGDSIACEDFRQRRVANKL